MTNRRPHDLATVRTSECVPGAGQLTSAGRSFSGGTGGRLAVAGPAQAGLAVAARWQGRLGPMTVATFEGYCLLSAKDISREVLPT